MTYGSDAEIALPQKFALRDSLDGHDHLCPAGSVRCIGFCGQKEDDYGKRNGFQKFY